ncbi:hypothetical protein [Streptomyces sp. 11x1]|nr:hypothetical protein [Streptomyces sp. 11x1]WNZ14850.1 hypothetical protein P8T65_10040 [Streptomyces sp. 11x1]
MAPERETSWAGAATDKTAPYPHFPYHRQEGFARLNPPVVAPPPAA